MIVGIHVNFAQTVSYYTAGEVGTAGFSDWIGVRGSDGQSVAIAVDSVDLARSLESAARQCAEAIEAREKIDEAIEAQGKPTDHESATGNDEEPLCPTCRGSGDVGYCGPLKCSRCGGSGIVRDHEAAE